MRPEVARQVGARCAVLRAEFRAASAGAPPGRLGLNATPVGLAELVGREVRTGLGQGEGAPHGRQGLLRGAPASVCCASPRRRDWARFFARTRLGGRWQVALQCAAPCAGGEAGRRLQSDSPSSQGQFVRIYKVRSSVWEACYVGDSYLTLSKVYGSAACGAHTMYRGCESDCGSRASSRSRSTPRPSPPIRPTVAATAAC